MPNLNVGTHATEEEGWQTASEDEEETWQAPAPEAHLFQQPSFSNMFTDSIPEMMQFQQASHMPQMLHMPPGPHMPQMMPMVMGSGAPARWRQCGCRAGDGGSRGSRPGSSSRVAWAVRAVRARARLTWTFGSKRLLCTVRSIRLGLCRTSLLSIFLQLSSAALDESGLRLGAAPADFESKRSEP